MYELGSTVLRPDLWGGIWSIGNIEGVAGIIQLAVVTAVDEVEFADIGIVAAGPQVEGDQLTSCRMHIAV